MTIKYTTKATLEYVIGGQTSRVETYLGVLRRKSEPTVDSVAAMIKRQGVRGRVVSVRSSID